MSEDLRNLLFKEALRLREDTFKIHRFSIVSRAGKKYATYHKKDLVHLSFLRPQHASSHQQIQTTGTKMSEIVEGILEIKYLSL